MREGYFVRLRSNPLTQKRISAQRPKPRGTDFPLPMPEHSKKASGNNHFPITPHHTPIFS